MDVWAEDTGDPFTEGVKAGVRQMTALSRTTPGAIGPDFNRLLEKVRYHVQWDYDRIRRTRSNLRCDEQGRICTADAEVLRSAQCDDVEIKAHLFMHTLGRCPTYGDDQVREEYVQLITAFGGG